MKTGFLTFSDFHGRPDVGSTKIRANWLIENWQSYGKDVGTAERFKIGQKYDVVVFQKAYYIDYAKSFRGIKILDVCDPDFLNWSYPVMEMVGLVDAVTCSTLELAKLFAQVTDKPVAVIPDRVDPKFVKRIKEKHEGEGKYAVWFGYSDNHPVLDDIIPVLHKAGFSLIVVSNRPYVSHSKFQGFEIINYPWTDATAYQDICRGDVVVNPKRLHGKWLYKSDNKTIISYQLGMPVAHTKEELIALKSADLRNKVIEEAQELLKTEHHISRSVIELKDLIYEITEGKGHPTADT